MKIALRSLANGKFVTMWDTGILRADRDEVGIGEEFELVDLDPVPPVPPAPTWPPKPGEIPVMPPDIDTADVAEVQARVRYALWACASDDDESYWMRAIVLAPEPGHTPGWTADGYWRLDKIFVGDGVGKGYVWPPK